MIVRYCEVLERINDFIDKLVSKQNRFLERELVWVKDGKYWWAFQDCMNDPYLRRDVAFYDNDLFLFHIIETSLNPNLDPNVPYNSKWGTYNLQAVSLSKAIEDFINL